MIDLTKCCVCGAVATVFVSETDNADSQLAYCESHAKLDVRYPSSLNQESMRLDALAAMVELRGLIQETGVLPFDKRNLPSGKENPLFGRQDLQFLDASTFLKFFSEI